MSQEKLTEMKETAIAAESSVENLKAELNALTAAEEVDKGAIKLKKAEVRSAESVLKKAVSAITKEEARLEREGEREAKKAEKETEKQKRKDEREAKAAQAKSSKEAKAVEREAKRMPEQNGVRRPKPDTLCGKAWELADTLSEKLGQPTPIKDLLEAAKAEGYNEGNVKAEYARWRKFHGVTGRVSLPKAETGEEAK